MRDLSRSDLDVDYTDALRRIAMVDAAYVNALLSGDDAELRPSVDRSVLALARVAALAH